MSKKNYRILCTGFFCMDIVKTENVDRLMLGGTAANVASILSVFGMKTWFAAMEYNNKLGKWLERAFYDREISLIYFGITNKDAPKVIEVPDFQSFFHKFYTSCPICGKKISGCILPTSAQIDRNRNNMPEDINVFFFDRMSEGIKTLIRLNVNGWNFYEPNSCRNYNSLLANILLVDIVKFSQERIPDVVAERLVSDTEDSNLKLFIVTMGKKGLRYRYRLQTDEWSNWIYITPVECVNFVDSSGSGDWLTVGIIYYLLQTYPFCTTLVMDEKILEHIFLSAQQLASVKCGYLGAQGILSDEEGIAEIQELMGFPVEKLKESTFSDDYSCYFCKG